MLIDPERINKILNLAGTLQINKGKKYYEQNRVSILSVNKIGKNDFKIKTAVSDIDTYHYFVMLESIKNNISFKCDCKEHKRNGALCSHIIATLFDVYIDSLKYEEFKNSNGIAPQNISEEELKKYVPIELNRKDVVASISNILHLKDENKFVLLYKLILDLFNRAKKSTVISYIDKFVNNENDKIKVFSDEIKNPTLTFRLYKKEGKNYIKSNISKYDFFVYKKSLYYKYQDEIFKCSNDFIVSIIPFIIYYKYFNSEEIIIKNSKEFEKYILAILVKEDFTSFSNKQKLEEICKKYMLKSKIYFDISENQDIILIVKYEYDKNEYDYFLDSKKDLNLRNEYAEESIKHELISYGFKFTKDKIYLDDEDKKYILIKEGIDKLKENNELYFSENFKKKRIVKFNSVNFKVAILNDLVTLDISNYDMKASDLKKILDSYKIKKKFFKLKDGSYIDLENNETEEFFLNFRDIINYSKLSNDNKLTFDKRNVTYLDYILSKSSVNLDYDKSFKSYIKNIDNFKYEEFSLPKYLNANLRNYQVEGYNYLMTLKKYNLNGILADEMGLGKTLQVITVLESEKEKRNGTSIVVCPSSLYLNWQKEIEKFAPNLSCLTIYGNTRKREKLISKIDKYDVVVTSYDILKRDIEKYVDFNFNYVVADEAQYIKNTFTKNAKALKLLKSENKLALTGTPLENSLSEIWSIFDFIMPGYLFSYNKFKEKFEKRIVLFDDKETSKLLKKMISPFILRRLKKDVLDDLPKKSETIIYNIMGEEQQKVYDSYLLKANKEIREELIKSGMNKSQMRILSIITRLRQICLHPKLFIENYTGESAKLEQCIELIKDMINSNHKIVLFSGFTSMFNIIEEKLNENSIKFYKLEGDTKASVRLDLVNKFNKEDNDIKVFLISLKAGGVGLNLTGADVVMHFDPWWNLSKEMQATDRTHRIGQKKNVQVFKYITQNSIEEKIQKMQINKKELVDLVLNGENNFINKLTEKELLELFEK